MEGTGLGDGKSIERDMLRQLFAHWSVYQNQRGRLVKQSLGPTPRVSDSVVLGLPYLNFSLGVRSKFEFRALALAAVKTHASYFWS